MSDKKPCIVLNEGLEIGYNHPLARFDEQVCLEGGTHFLLARNGRGKTTLLRTLANAIKPFRGHFQMKGFIQYLPENMQFDREITPKLIFQSLLQKNRRQEALDLAESIELDITKTYSQLSTGNRRKTNLIMAEFSIQPESGNILLLDEPFSGLDAFARQAFENLWKSTSDQVLRFVSCHPDYDSMVLSSALVIDHGHARHYQSNNQTWEKIRTLLH